MASLNSPCDSHTGSDWAQYDTGYPEHFSSPHQLPTLCHRASTGQLNSVAYPATPLTGTQTQYPQWNQSPNISYWQGSPAPMHYQNYYPPMPPPPGHTLQLTPTPFRSRTVAPKPYTKRLKVNQKLDVVFNAIDKEAHWTFSEFLYYAFQVKSQDGKKLRRTRRHAAIVSRFLAGRDKYCVSHILGSWIQTPDGRPQSPEDLKNMYSPSTPFIDIRPARPAITSFAVQLVQKKLTQERMVAVRPSNGLYASTSAKSPEKGVSWDDIGLTTVADVTEVLKKHQPLTWHYLMELTTPKARKRRGQVIARKYRPPEVVRDNFATIMNLHYLTNNEGLHTFA
jgi:hypothetical protein